MTKARDIASAAPAPSTVSATELGYLDGVTSAIQTQFANISGSKAQPSEPSSPTDGMIWVDTDGSTTDANFIPNTLMDAKGDIIAASAADTPAKLTVGSNNTVLTADSSTATGLKWAALPASGKVLQVVSTTYSTATTIASTSFTDTGLSLSITPSSASNKVLVIVDLNLQTTRATSGVQSLAAIVRGASVIYDTLAQRIDLVLSSGSVSSVDVAGRLPMVYLDSPATTSSTTYKAQVRGNATSNSQSQVAQYGSLPSSITLLEIGA
jgi:hypothetical protein